MKKIFGSICGIFFLSTFAGFGWDYEGHRLVNQVALTSLPANFPAFVRNPAVQERIAFLAGEPDRWRNTPDLPLQHSQEPEHFIDIEELTNCGFTAATLPHFRYDFISQVAAARKAHPELFPPGREDPARKYIWVGLLPWALSENYAKLKSEFSYLKTFEEGGTPEEIANAQQNIIYIMGVMGHYAGDASQRIAQHHSSSRLDWRNPKNYSTKASIHGWIDGGYIHKVGINFGEMKPRVRPARVLSATSPNAASPDIFPTVVSFIVEQNKLVEPLYQLDRDGFFSDHGDAGSKGRAFITQQLIAGGQLLGDLWVSAWQSGHARYFFKISISTSKIGFSSRFPL